MKTIMAERSGVVVAVSGGFDPIHIGHVRLFQEAKKLGDTLVVILNGDSWLKRKKGAYFMNQEDRAEIIDALACVDETFIWESEDDHVSGALEVVRPHIFANGGDRKNIEDIPEAAVCDRLGINMVFNIGKGGKIRSSSDLLQAYDEKNN